MQPNLPSSQEQPAAKAGYKKLYHSPLYSSGMCRVLILEAGSFNSPIICRLHTLSLALAHYTALSYVWGNTREMTSITVNGEAFNVGRNLETALRYLRKEKRPMFLWVDAICINQRDNIEKSYQVAVMSDIYHQAKSVVIFLGAGYSCSEFLDFCARFEFGGSFDSDDNDDVLERLDMDKVILQMFHLFNSPWWSRAWIVQELAHARNQPRIMYGHRKVFSHAFHEAYERIYERLDDALIPVLRDSEDKLGHYELLENLKRKGSIFLWRQQLHPTIFSVMDLLHTTRNQLTTDPRDKVFAFVSLMMEPIRTAFAPDYTKSVASVYTRMATYLLSIENCGRMYNIFPLTTELPSCPSWVPDFSATDDDKTHDILWAESPRLGIGDLQAGVNAGVLGIQGICCGKINATFAPHVVDDSISCHLVNEASQTMLATMEHTLAALTQGDTTEEIDALERLYAMMTAGPKIPFFTLNDLSQFMALVRRGYPSQVPRLLSLCKQDPSFNGELRDTIAREVQKMRPTFAAQRRTEREKLVIDEIAYPGRSAEERIIKELHKDHERNRVRASENREEQVRLKRKIKAEAKGLLNQAILKNTIFTTDTGFAGLGPLKTQQENFLVVLCGIDVAFVARSTDDGDQMVLVGKAWLSEETVSRVKIGIEEGELKERVMYFC